MPRFSIVIPTHDRGENGPKWMRELLDSLKIQTFQDFDIVVPDQSKNDKILDTCKEYSEDFEFTYIRYKGEVPCENINIGLRECTGEIVKIIFSDDVVVDENALQIINDAYISTNCKWAFSGFCGTKDGKNTHDHRIPRWTEHTLDGRNLLSSPSVVSFLNECKVEFDENLKLLLDVDFYHRIRMNHGHPHIIPEVLVANREHDDRISSNATSKYDCVVEHPEGGWLMNSKELQYVREKYPNFFPHRKYPDEN
jgi:glycosyltransferase involved in cell wall biosynthesis